MFGNGLGRPTSGNFSSGFVAFAATVPGNGDSITVRLHYSQGINEGDTLWKYKSNTLTWTKVSFIKIDNNTLSFTITDGGDLDSEKRNPK